MKPLSSLSNRPVTAQAHPRVKFARAISARNVFLAEVALGELETVLLEDALQMVYLYGEEGDRKYEAACRRYLAGGSRRSHRLSQT